MPDKIIFSVKYAGGAYTTQTVHGQRASCTHSALVAADSLARKLYPNQAWVLALVDSSQHGVRVFELELLK